MDAINGVSFDSILDSILRSMLVDGLCIRRIIYNINPRRGLLKDSTMYMHNRTRLRNAYLTISNPRECKGEVKILKVC